MALRTRLAIFVLLFGSAVLANILALFYLARSIATSMDVIERIGQRQLVAVQMNAHLRDAEAALYRYQINGEVGFKSQFTSQLDNFARDVEQYRQLATGQQEQTWVGTLELAYQQAKSTGDRLITLRDRQGENLQKFLTAQTQLTDLLLLDVKPLHPEDVEYQKTVTAMQDASRAMLTAVTDYLASPDETKRVQFTDAVINFHQAAGDYGDIVQNDSEKTQASKINDIFGQMQLLGSQLISEYDLQQSLYANFFAIIFNASQQTIVGEIEPHETEKFTQERQVLMKAVNAAIYVSILIAVLVSAFSTLFMFYLTRQINSRVDALLQGAERVASGELRNPVVIYGKDEFGRLAASFNKMMSELASREERLRALIGKMAQIQDEERRLIGLDLHDGLTQLAISANMHLNTLNALVGSKLDLQTTRELDVSRTLVKQTIDEARRVIAELRPTVVEDFGLEEGLRRYVAEVCESQKWDYEIITDIQGRNIRPPVDSAIFRLAQEALTNVRKHAHTQKVKVALKIQDEDLLLSVQDWGQGFDPGAFPDDMSHLGLVSMQERAQTFGGACNIRSKVGEGTIVEVRIPLSALSERDGYAKE